MDCLYCGELLTTRDRRQRCCSKSHAMAQRNRQAARPEGERFAGYVGNEAASGCTEWTGQRDPDGYGRFTLANRQPTRAHRYAWVAAMGGHPCVQGGLQDGVQVLHRCDNPPCVRVEHLFLGTNQDNVRDRDSKGRNAWGPRHGFRLHPELRARGQRVNTSRFTPEQVREIRRAADAGATHREQAERLGVTQAAIRFIVTRRNWSWLT
jgi:hypothetical protein